MRILYTCGYMQGKREARGRLVIGSVLVVAAWSLVFILLIK